jgi:hypothetical protein
MNTGAHLSTTNQAMPELAVRILHHRQPVG